ncbi:MAG: hypothetical protein ABSF15_25365, partial [Candidatus Sulfotelmatobacter sp.]
SEPLDVESYLEFSGFRTTRVVSSVGFGFVMPFARRPQRQGAESEEAQEHANSSSLALYA